MLLKEYLFEDFEKAEKIENLIIQKIITFFKLDKREEKKLPLCRVKISIKDE